jgi:hypothetical protein
MFTMYCVDKYNFVAEGDIWQINATNLDNGTDLSNTRLDGATFTGGPPTYIIEGLDPLTRYRAAVWLATRFDATGANWNGVQGAIWAVMTKDGDPGMWMQMGFDGGYASGNVADPDYWISQVKGLFTGDDPPPALDYKWWYVMSDVNTWTTDPTGARVEGRHKQEFLVHATPEPATYVLIVSGLLAVGVAARRRAKEQGYL